MAERGTGEAPLQGCVLCSCLIALRWLGFFQTGQKTGGKKRGRKSVPFLLIKGAVEEGSVFNFVELGRPVFSKPYQFGNVLSKDAIKPKELGGTAMFMPS